MVRELRWNPLLEEWTVVSSGRKRRPWQTGDCPFCPGRKETRGDWEVLALPNRFPALSMDAPQVEGKAPYVRSRAEGVCEVIIESREHSGDFHDFPLERVSKYVRLLAERSTELGSRPSVKHVMPFKNKGTIIGVSMTHPHSQIYALPFVPPRMVREIAAAKVYEARHRKNIFESIHNREVQEGIRLVYRNERFSVFVPFFATWPFEMHLYGSRPVHGLDELDSKGSLMLADAIRVVTATYERRLGRGYAYMMVIHQAPSKGRHPEFRLHIEFYNPMMEKGRMKYAAGIEWGAGTFTYDGAPEERAVELRKASVNATRGIEHLGSVHPGV